MAIDKLNIARSFSRAAMHYDSVAYLQREIGETLSTLLQTQFSQLTLDNIRVLVDLGCGTGHFANHLTSLYSQADYIGIDIAEGMVDYAHRQCPSLNWLCADAEKLPFDDNTIDCFFSNLTLQWCDNLPAVFAELIRSLNPGGKICFSTLGPSTLKELRSAWQKVDSFIHVNEFYPAHYWAEAIEDAGFREHAHSTELKILQYDEVSQLTSELKILGAHNMNTGQRQALSGRETVQHLYRAYEGFRKQGKLPATYEVYYWLLYKPLSSNHAT